MYVMFHNGVLNSVLKFFCMYVVLAEGLGSCYFILSSIFERDNSIGALSIL